VGLLIRDKGEPRGEIAEGDKGAHSLGWRECRKMLLLIYLMYAYYESMYMVMRVYDVTYISSSRLLVRMFFPS